MHLKNRASRTTSLCFATVHLILALSLASSSTVVRSVFDLKTRINRVTLTHTSSEEVNLYVASTNHLYRYQDSIDQRTRQKSLRPIVDLTTGPKLQKPQCAFLTSESSGEQCIKYICDEDSGNSKLLSAAMNRQQAQLIQNENRLLLVDLSSDQLIECGSIDYGGCRLRRLSDLSIIGCNYSAPLIPFSTASGVIVSQPAFSQHSSASMSNLYLMVSMETDLQNSKLEKSEFPVFSFRNLDSSQQQGALLFQPKYPIEYMNYDQNLFDADFHMKIKYSFKHNGYIYFLYTITNKVLTQNCKKIVTQQANNKTESIVVTRMVRICDTAWTGSDSSSRSSKKRNNNQHQENLERLSEHFAPSATNLAVLTELVLDCDDTLTGNKYHLLQSAFFLEQGDDATLLMSFNSSHSSTAKSAVCAVKLAKIEEHYSGMLRKCMAGDNSAAELVSPYSNMLTWKAPCRCSMLMQEFFVLPAEKQSDRKLFCHNDYFNYLNGRVPLSLRAIRMPGLGGSITGITALHTDATHQSGPIVLVLATSNAKVLMFTYDETTGSAHRYDQVDLLKNGKSLISHKYSQASVRLAAQGMQMLVADDYQLPDNAVENSTGNENERNVKERALYVTFDRFLYKLDLQSCDEFKTCDSCLGNQLQQQLSGNPFCGWCVYTQRCSAEHACLASSSKDLLASRNDTAKALWLNKPSHASECPAVTDIQPSQYFNPAVMSISRPSESIRFQLNLPLFQSASISYFCDVNVNFNDFSATQPSYSTTLNRIQAIVLDQNRLSCNLTLIKDKLQRFIRQVPIEAKLANLSVEIRAQQTPSVESKQAATLITGSQLFAFNCSYFTQCDQCLHPKLNSGCVWCAKNARCAFNTANSKTVNLFDEGYEQRQCPNEVEFYRNASSEVCTSFSSLSSKQLSTFQVPLTADSNIGKFTDLAIKNRRLSYQFKFRCLFTTTNVIDRNSRTQLPLLASNLIWRTGTGTLLGNSDYKHSPFDCVFSPHLMADIDHSQARQKVYLSVWWSNKVDDGNLLTNNYAPVSTDPQRIPDLDGWNQIQFQRESSDSESEAVFFANDSQLHKDSFIEIDVVSCGVKATSCGECMDETLVGLGCGWCKSSGRCSMRKDCPAAWMNDLQTGYCADPLVTAVSPVCGPRHMAGTKIVLEGRNLGMTARDVTVRFRQLGAYTSSLDTEDLECNVIDALYVKARRIVCQTKPILGSETTAHADKFSVYVQSNVLHPQMVPYSSFNATNQFYFEYITPTILSVEPQRGIKSGGTLLTITGKHLSCGSSLQFQMANGVCTILNITHSASSGLDTVLCLTPKYVNAEQVSSWNEQIGSARNLKVQQTAIRMRMDDYSLVLDENYFKFEYVSDPKIVDIEPDRSIFSGGLVMTVTGSDFENVQSAVLVLSPINSLHADGMDQSRLSSKCAVLNSTSMECILPAVTADIEAASEYSVQVEFNKNEQPLQQQSHQLRLYPDPTFKDTVVFTDKTRMILIQGENLLLGVSESDYTVRIGRGRLCHIQSITMNLIACIPDLKNMTADEADGSRGPVNSSIRAYQISRNTSELVRRSKGTAYVVQVDIGRTYGRTIGVLRLESDGRFSDAVQLKYIILVASVVSAFLFSTMIVCFVVLKQRQNKQIRQLKRMQTEFENLEMRVARECKEAFTELQMDIGELANTLNQTGAPFHDFQTYCMKILLPNWNDSEKYCMTTSIDLRLGCANKENVQQGVALFSQLILNKNFLLTLIRTLEADTSSFLMQDRVQLASYISLCLHDQMEYFTDVLFTLLAELIRKTVETRNNPKILLRRNESVVEKMLSNWFAFLLYDFIHNCAGTPLYILFLSIKQQIYKGPVDAFTCEARYSLSEDKLIRQSIEYETITIRVQLQDFDDLRNQELNVKVLSCDTVSQVKEKILDAFFKGYPFSKRPQADDLDLVYISAEFSKNNQGRLVLHDEDKTCKHDSDDSRRFNTLSHYKITSGSLLVLITRQSYQIMTSNDGLNSYSMLDTANVKNAENMTLLSKSSKGSSSPPTYSKLSAGGVTEFSQNGAGIYSAMNGSSVGLTESNAFVNSARGTTLTKSHAISSHSKTKKYHLIKPNYDADYSLAMSKAKEDKSPKMMSEVYLTRLLATKGGMQSYVDDFFETVFSTAHGSNVLPYAIKYLFDFLDEQATLHGITDPDVVYTWKSNSLPLRFWVNIIKNPDFVFDIHKSQTVDSSLSVIASTFMDSCSLSRLDLNKESPSGKLLFYKEVHKYRKWVESYYNDIRQMPTISAQDLSEMLNEESRKRPGVFNKNNALYRMYNDYVKKYRPRIETSLNNEQLDASVVSINKHLNYRLQQVFYLMEAIEV